MSVRKYRVTYKDLESQFFRLNWYLFFHFLEIHIF